MYNMQHFADDFTHPVLHIPTPAVSGEIKELSTCIYPCPWQNHAWSLWRSSLLVGVWHPRHPRKFLDACRCLQNGTLFERSPTMWLSLKRTLTVNCYTGDSLGLKNSCGTGCKRQLFRWCDRWPKNVLDPRLTHWWSQGNSCTSHLHVYDTCCKCGTRGCESPSGTHMCWSSCCTWPSGCMQRQQEHRCVAWSTAMRCFLTRPCQPDHPHRSLQVGIENSPHRVR